MPWMIWSRATRRAVAGRQVPVVRPAVVATEISRSTTRTGTAPIRDGDEPSSKCYRTGGLQAARSRNGDTDPVLATAPGKALEANPRSSSTVMPGADGAADMIMHPGMCGIGAARRL